MQWQLSTVKTLLSRLLAKGAVKADKDGRRLVNRPLLARQAWLAQQSTGLLERLFGGQLSPLVAQLAATRRLERFTAVDGAGVLAFISVRPCDGDALQGEDLIQLELELRDAQSGEALGRPRLVTRNGVVASLETGAEGGRRFRLELLPRYVQTRLHDSTGALAELRRDIEAGKAPALYLKP